MKTFTLNLLDGRGGERFDEVTQFIGADDSGSFGILACHRKMVAVLRYGLARFVDRTGRWRYLSLPGGVLLFSGDRLTLVTVRYFLGEDRDTMGQLLADEMAKTDSDVHASQATLAKIEQSLIRRLSELSRGQGGIGL